MIFLSSSSYLSLIAQRVALAATAATCGLFALASGACGSSSSTSGGASNPSSAVLSGSYDATTSGSVATLTFVDGSDQYQLVRNLPCDTTGSNACQSSGTYAESADGTTISLTDSVTGKTTSFPFHVEDSAPTELASLHLHPDGLLGSDGGSGSLVGGGASALLRKVTQLVFGGQTLLTSSCDLSASFLTGAGITPAVLATIAPALAKDGFTPTSGLEGFDDLPAAAKQDVLWQIHQAFVATVDPQPYRPVGATNLQEAGLAVWSDLSKTMTRTCDFFPAPKTKLVHTYGALAEGHLVIDNASSGYSGLFVTGAPALLRISLAEPLVNVDSGFIPGFGIKLLVSHAPSVNLVVMRNLVPQVDSAGNPDEAIFRNWWGNEFEPPPSIKMKAVGFVFQNALDFLQLAGVGSGTPFYRPLWPVAATAGGDVAASAVHVAANEVHAPRDLIFKVATTNAAATSADPSVDFRDKLASLAPGETLFQVYAKSSYTQGQIIDGQNPALVSDPEILVGHLVLDTTFSASSFADRILFWQHAL
jgi:hypothetical protein